MADYLAGHRSFINFVTDPVQRHCSETVYEHITSDVTRAITVSSLLEVWGVARERGDRDGDDLLVKHCTLLGLDDICGTPGFGEAMEYVEWASEDVFTDAKGREINCVRFPKFFKDNESPDDRYKKQHAQAQARYRAKQSGKSDVTRDDVTRDITVTPREEKRREEKKEKKERTPRQPKPKSEETTLRQWVEALAGADAIPADDPIFDWAGKQGIPGDWIGYAWAAFEDRYADKDRRYTDWRAAFRDHVKRGWLDIWRVDQRNGGYVLTTAGEQWRREVTA
jgi:hypothetical protein